MFIILPSRRAAGAPTIPSSLYIAIPSSRHSAPVILRIQSRFGEVTELAGFYIIMFLIPGPYIDFNTSAQRKRARTSGFPPSRLTQSLGPVLA